MKWDVYEKKYLNEAEKRALDSEKRDNLLMYAKKLYASGLPIIYDQSHLALLIGIDNEYLHGMSNAPEFFYRSFQIKKRNGKPRRIDEPLPDLKKVQSWILTEILYCVPCSKFAKAYIPKNSIKDNVRFHRKQNMVVAVDLKDFFPSIKSGRILNAFLSMGYNLPVATLLTRLCCLRECLPQGAPTSAYLSNLVLRPFDKLISEYCVKKGIRFTRYADDLTFSGDFDIAALVFLLDSHLPFFGLRRNKNKFKVMRSNTRQCVTGVIVNEKLQVSRKYRMKIRQEVHFIEKFGLDNHLSHIGEVRANYLNHLLGKIQYALFVNPNDAQMLHYLQVAKAYLNHRDMGQRQET